MKDGLMKKNILGVDITSASEGDILEYIVDFLGKSDKNFYIVTPNPEIVVFANKHEDFKTLLNSAEISLADGIGITAAGRFLGKPLKSRVTGIDLMISLCKAVAKKPITVGFLGAKDGIAEKASICLQKLYPGLQVAFAQSELASDFRLPPTDILFVAYGFPKQEKWMAHNINKVPVRVMMGVGGAFDYISGEVPRAPRIVRQVGFEWLFRLIVQPWRIKRQLALGEFVLLVLKEKLFH